MSPAEIVLALSTAVFVDYDPQVAEKLLAPDYIQHNLGAADGAAPLLGAIPVFEEAGLTVTQHRLISEGNMVVAHNVYDNTQMFGADRLVAFDVYRVEEGRVVEHWDNLQPWVEETVSGRSMVDGPTEVTDHDKTAENKALVSEFAEVVLKGGDVSKITDYISTERYDQHNPFAGDGLEGFGKLVADLNEQGVEFSYTDTPLIVAEGNFVFVGSEGTFGGAPTAFFDLFRVADGKIVEHWDVVSEIPPREEWKNDNGKF